MSILNLISLMGLFGLCAIAWLLSEHRHPKYFPWRVVIMGIMLQLVLGAAIFVLPGTRDVLQGFSGLLNIVFDATDAGARFVFGKTLIPLPGQESLILTPLSSNTSCAANTVEVVSGFCGVQFGYVFALRALPAVVFFSGLMALLYSIGVIQLLTRVFAKIFYRTMHLSGVESLSGATNIFVGIEAALIVKPFLEKATRSELCAILACYFGTSASSMLATYVSFLRPVFPNILGHLVSASIMAIPACFVLSKILVPETETPLTQKNISILLQDEVDDLEKMAPLDAAIQGALEGVKMAVSIAAVLILILGFVYLINQGFSWLALIFGSYGNLALVFKLENILGALFLPLTFLTGVSLEWNELWVASVIIGRRLFETAIPAYQALAIAAQDEVVSDRAVLIISYALSGFANLGSVGISIGAVSAMIPSRRQEISELSWKALLIGTLATLMIACIAGIFDTGASNTLGL
jgi:concentrative nucleoside transporter, CNT family